MNCNETEYLKNESPNQNVTNEYNTIKEVDEKNYNEIKKINTEENKMYREISMINTFILLFNLIAINISYLIFNNAQLTLILSFSNYKYGNDENLTTAIGTINTFMNILLYPLLGGLIAVIEILGSQAYGANKFYVFGCLINKARIASYFLIIVLGTGLFFFHDNMLNIWGLNDKIKKPCIQILILRMFSIILEMESYLVLRYIQIINKGNYVIGVLVLNGVLSILFCYLFIDVLNLHAVGCGMVYLVNNFTLVIFLWIFVYYSCLDKRIIVFMNKDALKNILQLFFIFIPLYLLCLMDIVSSETMSFLANYFDKKEYSAYVNSYSLYSLIGALSTTINISTNIIISTSIGYGNGHKTRDIFKHMLLYGLMIGGSVCFTLYMFSDRVISFVVEAGEIRNIAREMFHMSILCNFVDIITYVLNSSMKALGHVYLSLGIYTVSNLMNIFSIYYFAFNTQLRIYGIFIGYLINDTLLLVIYMVAFCLYVDFDKCADEVKKNIESLEDNHEN